MSKHLRVAGKPLHPKTATLTANKPASESVKPTTADDGRQHVEQGDVTSPADDLDDWDDWDSDEFDSDHSLDDDHVSDRSAL